MKKRVFSNKEATIALALYAFGIDAIKDSDTIKIHVDGKTESSEDIKISDITISIQLLDEVPVDGEST